MALIEESLISHLSTDTAINARLSGRIYPSDAIPQGKLDSAGRPVECLAYRKVGGEAANHQGGKGGLAQTIFGITAFAGSAKAASELMELIRLRCDAVRGIIGSGAVQATVRFMTLRDSQARAEAPIDGAEHTIYRDSKDLSIWHVVPTS